MDMNITKPGPKNLVTKSNQLIEAKYKLGLSELRIVLLLASFIHPDANEFETYKISIKDFNSWLGLKGKPKYQELEKITDDLQKKIFKIRTPQETITTSWLSSVVYHHGEGTVQLRFDPLLKPYLLELKQNFTSYYIQNVINLKSLYSVRIYELLKQYEKIGKRTFLLEELRDILGIVDQYPAYGNFKQKVLNVAQKELKKKSDISFDFKEVKQGRAVHKVMFTIKPNQNVIETLPPISPSTNDVDIKDIMDISTEDMIRASDDVAEIQKLALSLGFNVSNKVVENWIKYGKEFVIEVMESTRYNDKINNHIPYISKLLLEKSKEADTVKIDPEEVMIAKFIFDHSPKKAALRIEPLPDWMIEPKAIGKFQEVMAKEEAEQLWIKKKDYIMNEIRKNQNAAMDAYSPSKR
ncbi:Replication initiation protein [Peribacillus simplex]|uniref:replication initiation protein n=1 Tax=Peribacillus simplex TaxID=1478 RepID=UPI001D5E7AA4|nr:replication initiation protein [Peribacillus simplex]CAH0282348.1 Replication initiation protein [Peribacillus simplex]